MEFPARSDASAGAAAKDGALHLDGTFLGPADPPENPDQTTDHIALIYESRSEQFATVVPYLRRGLQQGKRCIYVIDDTTREQFCSALRSGGIDVDNAIETGALLVLSPAEIYCHSGEFDRDAVLDFWKEALEEAKDEGYTGIRAAGEMTWALDDNTTADQLTAYESLFNPVFEGEDCTFLCQYNRRRFPADVIDDIIETHPLLVQDNTVSRNVYYTPPEKFFGDQDPSERVDRKLRTLRERTETKIELQAKEQYLHRLYEIIADADRAFEDKLQAIFDLGCERFDMEMGALARVDPEADRFEVEITNGDHDALTPESEYALSQTYCQVTADERGTCSVTESEAFEGKRCYDQFGVRAYLGTYLEFDEPDDRTFWFASTEPRTEGFSDAERTFHHLMGQWIQYELRQRHQTDQLAALNSLNETARDINRALARQSTREEIERVVRSRLANSGSYATAMVGTVENDNTLSLSISANGQGERAVSLALDSDTLACRAARTGDPQFVRDMEVRAGEEPWREHDAREEIAGMAAIPIAYEDQQYGVLAVDTTREDAFDRGEREVVRQLGEIMGLAIAAIEHEQELAAERERLEFFNRLVRHNLLNGLNVVKAQANQLEPYVDPEAYDHVETARARTENMIDLIGALRSLMQSVVGTGDHELEPVDLGAVLDSEIEQARRTSTTRSLLFRGN